MRQPPDQDAGSWLVQMLTLSLLGLVMSSAKWCQVALTRASSLIMRQRVIVIASAGSSSAAWNEQVRCRILTMWCRDAGIRYPATSRACVQTPASIGLILTWASQCVLSPSLAGLPELMGPSRLV